MDKTPYLLMQKLSFVALLFAAGDFRQVKKVHFDLGLLHHEKNTVF
jgi:hypothetical protein